MTVCPENQTLTLVLGPSPAINSAIASMLTGGSGTLVFDDPIVEQADSDAAQHFTPLARMKHWLPMVGEALKAGHSNAVVADAALCLTLEEATVALNKMVMDLDLAPPVLRTVFCYSHPSLLAAPDADDGARMLGEVAWGGLAASAVLALGDDAAIVDANEVLALLQTDQALPWECFQTQHITKDSPGILELTQHSTIVWPDPDAVDEDAFAGDPSARQLYDALNRRSLFDKESDRVLVACRTLQDAVALGGVDTQQQTVDLLAQQLFPVRAPLAAETLPTIAETSPTPSELTAQAQPKLPTSFKSRVGRFLKSRSPALFAVARDSVDTVIYTKRWIERLFDPRLRRARPTFRSRIGAVLKTYAPPLFVVARVLVDAVIITKRKILGTKRQKALPSKQSANRLKQIARTAQKKRAKPDRILVPLSEVPALAEKPQRTVLLLGPASFRKGIWSTRAAYIFPDLLEPLDRADDIVLICGPIPDWALEEVHALEKKYRLAFRPIHDAHYPPGWKEAHHFWARVAAEAIEDHQPEVITNVFGGILFGYAMTVATQASPHISTFVRIAGDEIASRLQIGAYEERSFQHRLDLRIEAEAVQNATGVVVMTDAEKVRLAEHLATSPSKRTSTVQREESSEKIHVSVRGVDIAKFSPASPVLTRPRTRILFVGRRSREKGYDLAEALAQLCWSKGDPLTFHFAGTFEPGWRDNCQYYGFVLPEDLPDLCRSHDIILNTSTNEGLPQSLLEGLACGLPCVAPSLLFDGLWGEQDGVVLVDRDPNAFRDALLNLTQDSDRYRQFSEAARHSILERYDSRQWSQRYAALINGHTSRDVRSSAE